MMFMTRIFNRQYHVFVTGSPKAWAVGCRYKSQVSVQVYAWKGANVADGPNWS